MPQGCHVIIERGDGLLQGGMNEVGGELGKRFENEAALVETGVRDGEREVVDDAIVVEQDVEIDGARTPALCGGFPPALALNRLELCQQRVRIERGVNFGDSVEVRSLRRSADRLRLKDRRHLDKAYAVHRP